MRSRCTALASAVTELTETVHADGEIVSLVCIRVHQNVSLHISFLIFYGSLIGCIILLPQEVVL